MRRLLGRLLAIGADRDDDEDTRLRKVLLLVAALTIAPLAILWGLLYWLAGATGPALIRNCRRRRTPQPTSPVQLQRGMGRPAGTSSADSW